MLLLKLSLFVCMTLCVPRSLSHTCTLSLSRPVCTEMCFLGRHSPRILLWAVSADFLTCLPMSLPPFAVCFVHMQVPVQASAPAADRPARFASFWLRFFPFLQHKHTTTRWLPKWQFVRVHLRHPTNKSHVVHAYHAPFIAWNRCYWLSSQSDRVLITRLDQIRSDFIHKATRLELGTVYADVCFCWRKGTN